jgi:hypothetical protein
MLAILIIAAFIAAAISGAAGFGGALLLLPLLTLTVGPDQAVPLLTVAQFVGNLSRMAFGFRDIRWRPVALFLTVAVPFAVAGSLCFISLPGALIIRGIGLVLVVFAFLRWGGWLRLSRSSWLLSAGGVAVGFLSGLVGSAGPLGAAVFHALELPPVAYIATEATTALSLHAVKFAVYQRFIRFDPRFWWLAVTLGAAMVAGTWTSRRLVERLSVERFRAFVTFLLAAIGLYMLVTGSR